MLKKIFSLILVFALIGTVFNVANANEGSDSAPLFTYKLSDDFAYSQGVSNWYYMVHPRINNIPFAAANLSNMKATATSSTKEWRYASGNSTAKIYIDSNGPIFLPSTLAGGALVAFKAPLSGKITIDASGVLKRTKPGTSPSGAAVNCYVFKGETQLSLTAVPDNGDTGIEFTKLTDVSVNKGEYIYFFTDSAAGSSKDTRWDPIITYVEKGTGSVYELTTLVYKGEEEVELSDIAANETANIYVEVSAYTDNIINGKVIVALYNGDKVVGIKVADYNNAGATLPVTLTEDGSNLEMKVFVVKSLVSLTPICRNF